MPRVTSLCTNHQIGSLSPSQRSINLRTTNLAPSRFSTDRTPIPQWRMPPGCGYCNSRFLVPNTHIFYQFTKLPYIPCFTVLTFFLALTHCLNFPTLLVKNEILNLDFFFFTVCNLLPTTIILNIRLTVCIEFQLNCKLSI